MADEVRDHVTIVAWVEDAPTWERKLNQVPLDLTPDFDLVKAPADDWIEFSLGHCTEESACAQFRAAADVIGMPYRIDEVNF